jgi:two-component system CheB/CheR fusion protein
MGERYMLLNVSRVFIEGKAEELILLAIEDVTETKQLENELKKFAREQESLITERTAALKDANSLLQHSNENLEQFATLASHDLQEPLRKIMTFANLLNQRHTIDIKPEAKELLNKISVSAERMSTLIKGVLNFSRIVDSQNSFEKTDLNEILNYVITDFDLLITQKKALVNHEPLPVIDAIPLQINQLFYNLLGNSLKFSKTDIPPEINITSTILSPEDLKKHPALNTAFSYCEIVFSDKGIGFDKQFSDQIFLIFQRLNSREYFEGTGIGLALCKRIVINHHGEIYAESNETLGTQFHIILPIER